MLDCLQRWMGRGASTSDAVMFRTATLCDVGLVRAENQDHFLCHPETGLFCVADGMGGGKDGGLASQWTCAAVDAVARPPTSIEVFRNDVDAALRQVNTRIRAHAVQHGYAMMGTTLALLYVNPQMPTLGWVCHVGDSRIYRLRGGRLDPLTIDHTVGNALGRASFDDGQAQTLMSRQNPLSHILTRAVGTERRVNPEWRKVDVFRGDRYLLCSDGVHDTLSNDFLRRAMAKSPNPERVVEKIAEAVRRNGAADNYTIVCAFVNPEGSRR